MHGSVEQGGVNAIVACLGTVGQRDLRVDDVAVLPHRLQALESRAVVVAQGGKGRVRVVQLDLGGTGGRPFGEVE